MIHLGAIFGITGFLLLVEGIFILTGIPFSLWYGDSDIQSLLISGGITSLSGLGLYLPNRNKGNEIRKREGYLVVSTGWIVMSVFGALPFVIHGSIPSFTDAFFETMSGFTTTGASILNDIESIPHGLLYWRSLTQWLGGMGIIVFTLAILPILGIGGMQLFVAEVPGPSKDKIHPRIKETAKRLWGIYAIYTLAEILLLMIGGMSFYDALNHAFTTMATGGFSTKQASIAAFDNPFIHYVIIIFMFAAGMNFTLHYRIIHGDFKSLKLNDEFKFYAKVILIVGLVIGIVHVLTDYAGVERSFRDSLFQTVSIVTTTGYVTADYELWGAFFQLLFFLLLFTGGCAGSTGGGIKMVRHLILFRNSFQELRRLIHPRAVIPVRFNKNAISSDNVSNIYAFFLFYIAIFVIGTLALSLLGVDFLSSIGAVATSLGNVGPGIGSVGPSYNFSHLPDAGKWILSFMMLMGRLELFTVLILFSPSFWKK
ncbi:MAG: TrkH family potassium uptake protein [Ignavibacteria bacterium]|nr:MAG: TrkH family potassium uptake protein [Ignavibacteria bacterium]